MNKTQTAAKHFSTGKNCAQSVLLAFAEELNLPEDQVIRMTSGFGGGIAKHGHVCGAVSGAIIVLGMKYADGGTPDEANAAAYSMVNKFLEEFEKKNSSIMCKDLIDGLDLNDPGDRAEWKSRNLHDVTCLPVVESAVRIIETL